MWGFVSRTRREDSVWFNPAQTSSNTGAFPVGSVPTTTAATVYEVGQLLNHTTGEGNVRRCLIERVHQDAEPPYYTVQVEGGGVLNTDGDHLSLIRPHTDSSTQAGFVTPHRNKSFFSFEHLLCLRITLDQLPLCIAQSHNQEPCQRYPQEHCQRHPPFGDCSIITPTS